MAHHIHIAPKKAWPDRFAATVMIVATLFLFYDMEVGACDAVSSDIAKLEDQQAMCGEDDGGSSGSSTEVPDGGCAGSSLTTPHSNSGGEKGDDGFGGHDHLTARQASLASSAAFSQKLLDTVGTLKANSGGEHGRRTLLRGRPRKR